MNNQQARQDGYDTYRYGMCRQWDDALESNINATYPDHKEAFVLGWRWAQAQHKDGEWK